MRLVRGGGRYRLRLAIFAFTAVFDLGECKVGGDSFCGYVRVDWKLSLILAFRRTGGDLVLKLFNFGWQLFLYSIF